MVYIYFGLIQLGKKTIENVPTSYIDEVIRLLEEAESNGQ